MLPVGKSLIVFSIMTFNAHKKAEGRDDAVTFHKRSFFFQEEVTGGTGKMTVLVFETFTNRAQCFV